MVLLFTGEPGKHVRVKGTYVWDSEPGHGWMEIHPVTNIEVIP
jgi:hypothetical protein